MIHEVKRLANVYEKDMDSIFGMVRILGDIEPVVRDISKADRVDRLLVKAC